MKLYNVYTNCQSAGIQVKVGDMTRCKVDKHKASHDQLVGFISARNRADGARIVQELVSKSIRSGMRFQNQGRSK